MFKWLVLILPVVLYGNLFKERLLNAQVGDYVVTEYQEVLSMLRVHSVKGDLVTLEEVNVPWHQMRGKSNFKGWLQNGAKGQTSWIRYTLDLKENKMVECFSPTRDAYLDTSDSLITELLSLKMTRIADHDRKRVGPPPLDGQDTRSFWTPMITREGVRKKPVSVEVWQTKLPIGDTPLSGKIIDLYFEESLPFPYWIQIHDGALRMRMIDSGTSSL